MADENGQVPQHSPWMLCHPGAPGAMTVGAAILDDGTKVVLLIIETDTASERHFLPIEMAKTLQKELNEQIEECEKPSLQVVERKLIDPRGN